MLNILGKKMKRHYKCKLTIEEEAELIAYYKQGNSLSKTGVKYSLSLTGVQKILKAYSIERRTISDAQTGVFYNTKEKFFNSLKKEDDCLLWQGATSWGYGTTCYEGKYISTHRLAYILENGPIPQNKQVLHKCDTPLCCSPKHLFLGTHQINMKDRNKKGRARGGSLKGEANPSSRFTNAQILKMRSLYNQKVKQNEIAELFNTTQPVISAIINKKYWNHL